MKQLNKINVYPNKTGQNALKFKRSQIQTLLNFQHVVC